MPASADIVGDERTAGPRNPATKKSCFRRTPDKVLNPASHAINCEVVRLKIEYQNKPIGRLPARTRRLSTLARWRSVDYHGAGHVCAESTEETSALDDVRPDDRRHGP